jgi:hypothetical protein
MRGKGPWIFLVLALVLASLAAWRPALDQSAIQQSCATRHSLETGGGGQG